jgi:hypothetical protein
VVIKRTEIYKGPVAAADHEAVPVHLIGVYIVEKGKPLATPVK